MSAHTSPTQGPKRVRVHHLAEAKARGEKLAMLTAYDAVTAAIFDAAGMDILLVGDSIGNVMHGHATTIPVTVDDMIPAARAVARATKRAFVVIDLPFGSYEAGPQQALETAVRVFKETGADAVKLEGGIRSAAQIRALTDAGIPVVAHLGYTPQSENLLGGPRVQGRGDDAVEALAADAQAVEEAGAVAVVLEMVPAERRRADHRDPAHPDHRHRRRAALRRPGAGVDGHGGHDRAGRHASPGATPSSARRCSRPRRTTSARSRTPRSRTRSTRSRSSPPPDERARPATSRASPCRPSSQDSLRDLRALQGPLRLGAGAVRAHQMGPRGTAPLLDLARLGVVPVLLLCAHETILT